PSRLDLFPALMSAQAIVDVLPPPDLHLDDGSDWDDLDARVAEIDYWEMLFPSQFAAPTKLEDLVILATIMQFRGETKPPRETPATRLRNDEVRAGVWASPNSSWLLILVGLGPWVEVVGNYIRDPLLAIGGGDSKVLASAKAPRLGQSLNERFRKCCVVGGQRIRFSHQARRAEGVEKIRDARRERIFRTNVLLSKSLFAQLTSFQFVRQKGQRRQVEHGVNKLHHGGLTPLRVRNVVSARVGRNHDEWNARPIGDYRVIWTKIADRRLNVVIVALRVVPGYDDGALVPIRTRGDFVDRFGYHGFADLRIRIGRMIIITEEIRLDLRIRIDRLQAEQVRIASLDEKDAALPRERTVLDCAEEVTETVKLLCHLGVVCDVAEILRPVVVGDVGSVSPIRVHGTFVRIGHFLVKSFFVPTEGNTRLMQLIDEFQVVLHVAKVATGIAVRRGFFFQLAARQCQRESRKSQVELYAIARKITGIHRQLFRRRSGIGWRSPKGITVVDQWNPRQGSAVIGIALVRMQSPLRLARLGTDNRQIPRR